MAYWHREDWDLGDRAVFALYSACSLVEGGQICIEVTWVGSTSWDFLPCRRHLSEGIGIGTHIRHNNQDVQLPLIRKILGRRQGQPGRDNPFDGWIISQIEEEDDPLHGPVLLEIGLEEPSHLHIDTHSGKHHTEVLLTMVVDVFALHQ